MIHSLKAFAALRRELRISEDECMEIVRLLAPGPQHGGDEITRTVELALRCYALGRDKGAPDRTNPPKRKDTNNLSHLEAIVRVLGDRIGAVVKLADAENDFRTNTGFALFIFDMGELGHITYLSNAQRDDMIATMKEWIAHAETGVIAPLGSPKHPANNPGKS